MATGEIDIATAAAFGVDLRHSIDTSHAGLVVVDCTGLDFIDSSGFHALVDATAYAAGRDHTLVIRHMRPTCSRVIELCDWDHLLQLDIPA